MQILKDYRTRLFKNIKNENCYQKKLSTSSLDILEMTQSTASNLIVFLFKVTLRRSSKTINKGVSPTKKKENPFYNVVVCKAFAGMRTKRIIRENGLKVHARFD